PSLRRHRRAHPGSGRQNVRRTAAGAARPDLGVHGWRHGRHRDRGAAMKGTGKGSFTRLMARDGHEFDAWLSPATSTPRGAIVVLQEIFGVNPHIRAVADGFAAEGYVAIAPALFDWVKRGVELEDRKSGV